MGRKSREFEIVATNVGGQISFEMREHGSKVPKSGNMEVITFDKKKEKMKKYDTHEIHFELNTDSGADVAFTKNLVNVLWAAKVTSVAAQCPISPSHLPGEFFAVDVNNKQDELTVINTNMTKDELIAFRLNFVPKGIEDVDPGQPYPISYDPIGGNQDGQYPLIVPLRPALMKKTRAKAPAKKTGKAKARTTKARSTTKPKVKGRGEKR